MSKVDAVAAAKKRTEAAQRELKACQETLELIRKTEHTVKDQWAAACKEVTEAQFQHELLEHGLGILGGKLTMTLTCRVEALPPHETPWCQFCDDKIRARCAVVFEDVFFENYKFARRDEVKWYTCLKHAAERFSGV